MRLYSPPQPVKHVDLVVHLGSGRCRASVFVGNRRAIDADRALVLHSATFPVHYEVSTRDDVLALLREAVRELEEHPDALSS